jgi:hypothetical protein
MRSMRHMLLLASAVALVAAVIIATSSAARRPLAPEGPGATARAALPASTPVEAPAPRQLLSTAGSPTPENAPLRAAGSPSPIPAPGRTPGSASLVLTVDPETGRLGLPETGQQELTISELQAYARTEAEGLVTVKNADGSETLNHAGRFADHSIARVGPNGRVTYGCVQGEAELEHALHATPSAKSATEEK